MLNPFTPASIAALPDLFFGRDEEVRLLERSVSQGSVLIQGPVGIGKSSLLSFVRTKLEGFDSNNACDSVILVCDREATTADDLARRLLYEFVTIDETANTIGVKLFKSTLNIESREICRFFTEGRHLDVLVRIVEHEEIRDAGNLIIAVDEADKSAAPLARLIRTMLTSLQQRGVMNVKFLLAGVSPFFKKMVEEDPGVQRFFSKRIPVGPLSETDAINLLETKLQAVVDDARAKQIDLRVDPDLMEQIANLSGGHPHLLQLLGSHLIENEEQDPDNLLDWMNLIGALRTIVYEDRDEVYKDTIEALEMNNLGQSFRELLRYANSGVPTIVARPTALDVAGTDAIEWMVDNNVLTPTANGYALVDEFLRIRLLMDEQQDQIDETEIRLLQNLDDDESSESSESLD